MEVKRIFIHPIKSLKGIEVNESPVDEYGFRYDREYVLATPTKDPKVFKMLTQRTEPKLVLITPRIVGEHIILSSPATELELQIPADPSRLPSCPGGIDMDIWGRTVQCYNVGAALPEIAQWFAMVLGSKYSNVTLLAPQSRRLLGVNEFIPEKFTKETHREIRSEFQDVHPGSLVATASLEDINRRVGMATDGVVDITVENFRPNLLISSEDPYEEDDWKIIKIGQHEWLVSNPTERCSMPTVLTEIGEFEKTKEPIRSLTKFRVLTPGRTPSFGVNLVHRDANTIVRVGDKVEIIEKADF